MEVLGLLRSKAVFCISTKFLYFCFNYLSKSALQKKKKKIKYLTGVLGLPMNLRGDRIFGSKENFSFTLSSTDGATYVKPCKTGKRHCNSQARMHSGSPRKISLFQGNYKKESQCRQMNPYSLLEANTGTSGSCYTPAISPEITDSI